MKRDLATILSQCETNLEAYDEFRDDENVSKHLIGYTIRDLIEVYNRRFKNE